jgi:hypothetical protein
VLSQGTSSAAAQLGNLPAPLPKWQILGIWPVGDFRYPGALHYRVTYALLGVVIASGALGTLWMIRRRAFGPLLMLISSSAATAYLLSRASPYASAKVMMIFSVAVLVAAMLGAAALHDSGRRIEGWLLAGVIAAGVLWTNALQYHYASVAPRGRFAELAMIGSRFSGQGPALYNQSDEFAIHFLRREALDDPATGPVTPRPGLPPRAPSQVRLPWDPDDLAPSYVQKFRLLVLGRSPRISRPPANFELAYRGRYYDVWRRTSSPQVLDHIPLGGGLYPVAVPSCRLIMSIAERAARAHARIAFVPRAPAPALVPTQAAHPPNWGAVDGDPYELVPRSQAGAVTGTIHVAQPGRYQVWLESALSQSFPVWIGSRNVGSVAYQLGPPGQFVQVGQVTLGAGQQPVKIIRPGSNLKPGDDGTGRLIGPLMLVRVPDPPPARYVGASRARSVCGRSLDWLEIVR